MPEKKRLIAKETITKMDSYEKKMYEDSKSNPNNMSNWLPKVAGCGISIPQTIILPLSFNQFFWILNEGFRIEGTEGLSNSLIETIKDKFDTSRPIFLKTGTFSDKFNFSHCKLTDPVKVGEHFIEIAFSSMLLGAGYPTEIVFREFIESKEEKPTIYNGLPLNCEFRAFYDFDNKEVLDVFNYWDTETMIQSLKGSIHSQKEIEEYQNFVSYAPTLEKEFEQHKDEVRDLINEKMTAVNLQGIWSIDLMLVDGTYYLIDMAVGKQSYYYERIQHLIDSNQ